MGSERSSCAKGWAKGFPSITSFNVHWALFLSHFLIEANDAQRD